MMPMPIPKIRAKRFNRMSKEDYITWLSGYIGVEADSTVYSKTTRMQIDERFEYLMSQSEMEQPPWVDAAEEVLATPVEEVVEEEVVEEEVVEEEVVEEEVVEEEVLSDSPFDINTNYDSMTVAELRELCKQRGLTIRGTKAEVVLRLRRDDEGITEDTQPDDGTETPAEEAAVEESSDAPAEEAAVTEEVTNNDESSEQEEDIDE